MRWRELHPSKNIYSKKRESRTKKSKSYVQYKEDLKRKGWGGKATKFADIALRPTNPHHLTTFLWICLPLAAQWIHVISFIPFSSLQLKCASRENEKKLLKWEEKSEWWGKRMEVLLLLGTTNTVCDARHQPAPFP